MNIDAGTLTSKTSQLTAITCEHTINEIAVSIDASIPIRQTQIRMKQQLVECDDTNSTEIATYILTETRNNMDVNMDVNNRYGNLQSVIKNGQNDSEHACKDTKTTDTATYILSAHKE